MIRLVGVGDNTVDKYLHLRMMFPGGNAVNVPVLAQRYGHQGSYIGCLGHDDHGSLIVTALKEEGIDISHCHIVEGPNAYCEVSIVEGERIFGESSSGVSSLLQLKRDDLAFIDEHDLTHTSIYSSLEAQLPSLRNVSTLLSFDFSQDWNKHYLVNILPFVDIAILSFVEGVRDEIESLLRWVKSLGPQLVILTRGKMGAFVYNGGRYYHQPPAVTEVRDSLGAGDAFAARFLVEYADGTPIEIALEEAAKSAAETCSYYGAFGYGVPF